MSQHLLGGLPPGVLAPGMAVAPRPTQAQLNEVEKVRAMQVRTNAANVAGQCLQGQGPTAMNFVALAAVIEAYINGDAFEYPAPARLSS